ncbi:NAD(P)-binding protein [Aspergillus steynii IBT 23096]|uniref:NAD(P)-binding protein n=1 Tax=Aspergillus steynii IBT 23096 TaxID=1392250 RepID=A0A2I2G6V3_9EURO|nr:NAD(P)-binding protein [Aspergillus steynii IBT 23096]PLB48603.1 NAD(P)-binding protein [Aspergillus steynii IBT 23096]
MVFATLCNAYTQIFPPSPVLTEQNVPSQAGRVFIVTGGNGGVGLALCRILYGTGATIYMASRSKERAEEAIRSIASSSPTPANPGRLLFLQLDLNDLESVKAAAAHFATQETKLDILWNNAGMGANRVAPGTQTAQGFEAMVGMHCIATLLFTDLLRPQLRSAAASQPTGAVRVVWTSSYLAEGGSPTNGIDFATLGKGSQDRVVNYAVSKAGTWMLGREMARRYAADGIVSVVQNPGNLKAGSYEGTPALTMCFVRPLLHETRFGAYTELYCGLSPDITAETSGAYVIPWGRIRPDKDCPRTDIIKAMMPVEDGGLGYASKLWDWCEEQWKPFI